jgi:hypothetical protein
VGGGGGGPAGGARRDAEELHDLGFDARLEEIEEQDNSGPGCSLPS